MFARITKQENENVVDLQSKVKATLRGHDLKTISWKLGGGMFRC